MTQTVPTEYENFRFVADSVLLEASSPLGGFDPVVVDSDNLVVNVEAVSVTRCVSQDVRHDEPSAVIACGEAEPGALAFPLAALGLGLGGLVRVLESQAMPTELLRVLKFFHRLERGLEPRRQFLPAI
jgi:hypothetical protein